MADVLKYEVSDHVARLTLNRPEAMNALNSELKRALIEAAHDASTDPDVWVVVLSGAGDRAFCVGGDLKEMGRRDDSGQRMTSPMLESERNVYETILEIPKPTIAVIDGYALGGGFELALACDLRVCTDRARFGLPEATIGMGANFGSVLLPRLIPRAVALEMLYFGRRMSGDDLCRLGLVNHVWPSDELDTRLNAWLDDLGQKAPVTLQRYKHMALKGWELPVAVNLRLDVGPNPYTSEDRVEGNRAFREKRRPEWRNR